MPPLAIIVLSLAKFLLLQVTKTLDIPRSAQTASKSRSISLAYPLFLSDGRTENPICPPQVLKIGVSILCRNSIIPTSRPSLTRTARNVLDVTHPFGQVSAELYFSSSSIQLSAVAQALKLPQPAKESLSLAVTSSSRSATISLLYSIFGVINSIFCKFFCFAREFTVDKPRTNKYNIGLKT